MDTIALLFALLILSLMARILWIQHKIRTTPPKVYLVRVADLRAQNHINNNNNVIPFRPRGPKK